MAYVRKELVQRVRAELKNEFPQFKFAVRKSRGSYSLHVVIKSGMDFIQYVKDKQVAPQFGYMTETESLRERYRTRFERDGYFEVHNLGWYLENTFEGKGFDVLKRVSEIMNDGNHDRSDSQSDYFDVGWYTNLSIGEFGKPYQVVPQ